MENDRRKHSVTRNIYVRVIYLLCIERVDMETLSKKRAFIVIKQIILLNSVIFSYNYVSERISLKVICYYNTFMIHIVSHIFFYKMFAFKEEI